MTSHLRVGIDIGGTFTDFVVWDLDGGGLSSFKLPSTPGDPGQAVVEGLGIILANSGATEITVVHGSTVATNALIERKGVRTALVATSGFRDVLQIGRQNRPVLYDLFADPPPSLVPPGLRFEVDERIDKDGNVLRPLRAAEVHELDEKVRLLGAESVALCLLFSFANPEHEQLIAGRLRASGLPVSVSSEILPEFREYERASTTAVNAYVSPLLENYLANLESRIGSHPSAGAGNGESRNLNLQVMQSNGGIISPAEARKFGVRCILSGPAGGVMGCYYVARQSRESGRMPAGESLGGQNKLITFDMGGTSTDVSLIDGQPGITADSTVAGYPIHIPMLDIHTIGAGGGSIASIDAGGALRVGPESAGVDPGPACYGRRTDLPPVPTVTDANLVLGRLVPDYFLGGEMPLIVERAWEALARLGLQLGLDAVSAALGVVQVVNAHMERALRVISVERGHDPRDCTLLSFGGAGGLHSADLARSLGVGQVLIPPLASTLSAMGMLATDVARDYAQTVMLGSDTAFSDLEGRFSSLAAVGRREVADQGIPEERIRLERSLDMRYRGQSYELPVPFTEEFQASFHTIHQRSHGYARPDAAIEIVNIRVRATGEIDRPRLGEPVPGDDDPSAALLEERPVTFSDGERAAQLYRAELLRPGNRLAGPAIVVRADTTVVVGPEHSAHVDAVGNLLVDVGAR